MIPLRDKILATIPRPLTSHEIDFLAAAGTPPNMDPETWSRLFDAIKGMNTTAAGQDAGKGKGKDTGKGASTVFRRGHLDAEGGGGGKGKGKDVGGGGGKGKGEDAGATHIITHDADNVYLEYGAQVYLMEAGTGRITSHIITHDADTDDIMVADTDDIIMAPTSWMRADTDDTNV
jgi:hypothetical protein